MNVHVRERPWRDMAIMSCVQCSAVKWHKDTWYACMHDFNHVMLCYVKLCHAMVCYVMLCYGM